MVRGLQLQMSIVAILLIVHFISLCAIIPPEQFHSNFECATDAFCKDDSICLELSKRFREDSDPGIQTIGWTARYPNLGKLYNDRKVNISVEICKAQGNLSNYLLSSVRSLSVHYGIDPFIGDYDKSDAMSMVLKRNSNASTKTWRNAFV